jgi:hypothetical protein
LRCEQSTFPLPFFFNDQGHHFHKGTTFPLQTNNSYAKQKQKICVLSRFKIDCKAKAGFSKEMGNNKVYRSVHFHLNGNKKREVKK